MAVSSVVITIEGVLKKNVTNAPINTGIALYHGLANTFNVLLVSDLEKTEADRWCALEGLSRHAAVEYNEGTVSNFSTIVRRLHQVNNLRNRGYKIDIVIEPDPSISAKLLINGYNTMTFTHASYAMPQWRPDYEHIVKPWDEIRRYEEEMAGLKAVERLMEEEKHDTT